MSSLAIEVEEVSKRYRIGVARQPYATLRETIAGIGRRRPKLAEFDALRNVSFGIEDGESVAIIGRNGAGKSTLLKILSRITPPTTGIVKLRGRVASLLEVGTGFHPELTGRENVLLNGAILGLSRGEIAARFDEVVEFSGVEEFLETPIKHYSSGMQLRLAFAVAAHLEPEILIIDEVLAVGDASFQRRCLARMQEVTRQGRTVLFVSHNLSAVTTLCSRALLLEAGRVKRDGDASTVVASYMTGDDSHLRSERFFGAAEGGDDAARVVSVRLLPRQSGAPGVLPVGSELSVLMEYEILRRGCRPVPNYHLFGSNALRIATFVDPERRLPEVPGRYLSQLTIPAHFFNEGHFVLGVALSTLDPVRVHFQDMELLTFEVLDDLEAPTRNAYRGQFHSPLRPMMEWSSRPVDGGP